MTTTEEILTALVGLERHPSPAEIDLGKDGEFTTKVLSRLGELDPNARADVGRRVNALKAKVVAARERVRGLGADLGLRLRRQAGAKRLARWKRSAS